MGISPTGPDLTASGFRAVAGGVRGALDARHLRSVLDLTDLGDPALREALAMVEASSRSVTEAGVKLIGDGVRGTLLDILA